MKILLLKDIAHLGQEGNIKEVSPGYARNFLFPKGFAKQATARIIQEAERLKKEREQKIAAESTAFKKVLGHLDSLQITIEAKANEQDVLFRAISAKQIISALLKSGIKEIKEDDLKIVEPIKKVGEHSIKVERESDNGLLKIMVIKKS